MLAADDNLQLGAGPHINLFEIHTTSQIEVIAVQHAATPLEILSIAAPYVQGQSYENSILLPVNLMSHVYVQVKTCVLTPVLKMLIRIVVEIILKTRFFYIANANEPETVASDSQ